MTNGSTSEKLIKFDTTLLDQVDARIEELNAKHREAVKALVHAEDAHQKSIVGYATGKTSLADVKKAESDIETAKKDIEREASAIASLEVHRAETGKHLAPAIKQAASEAEAQVIEEYDAYFNDVLQPARIAYINTIAELGRIKGKMWQLRLEHSDNIRKAGIQSDSHSKYGFAFAGLPLFKSHGSADFSGNPEEKALALSEPALRRIYEKGESPKWAEVATKP